MELRDKTIIPDSVVSRNDFDDNEKKDSFHLFVHPFGNIYHVSFLFKGNWY